MPDSTGGLRGTGSTTFRTAGTYPRSFRYKDDESARLTKVKSKITAKEAEAHERGAFCMGFRLTENQLRLKEPPAVNQYKFEETDGTIYPLPMFNVAWRVKGSDDDLPPVEVGISGITKNVAGDSLIPTRTPHACPPRPITFAFWACRTTIWTQCPP